MDNVSFEVRLNEKDYRNFRYWHVYGSAKGRMIMGLFLFIVLDLWLLSLLLEKDEFGLFIFLSGCVSVLLFAYLVILPLIIHFQTGVLLKNDPILQENQHYEISGEGITLNTESTSARIKWDKIFKLTENKGYFYIYIAKNKALLIPKRVFAQDNSVQSLREIFKNSLPVQKLKIT